MAQKSYRFEAIIETGEGGGAYVLFPYDVEREFGTKGRVAVQASFDGVPYRGSLIRYGRPQHQLGILKAIREQIRKQPGETVQVEIRKDDQPRDLSVPAEFAEAMKRASVLPIFEALSYTHRREYVQSILDAKKEETRARRIENAIGMLRDKSKKAAKRA